ncbi:acyl-CoA thioesterase II [Rhinocladiella mackenziei CBS 650.93]|uniref:Acyl-CoA thioesterase II n=1 Tax=Rhinocladiella mackenziei CBS 650.93 TaxID=1442369 RepID=A0A0D2IFL3_9EURO|nr:acyl-CoA thioesterase II [Rhinocladiella mackenziei CBS 650.93]KIX04604.1 acyl-CoA thioesterase II [Rhinocladiella mackenziei CBS 650.93]
MDDDQTVVFRPPDTSKSIIENILEVTPLASTSAKSTLFTNARPLWYPPDARGIYGGICLAQSLNAAQATVPQNFVVHSMHGQFVLAGNADNRLLYHIDNVNNGKSFATRAVKVTQGVRTIFIAIINFVREMDPGRKHMEHSEPIPHRIPGPPLESGSRNDTFKKAPYVTKKVGLTNSHSRHPHQKRIHQWSKASDKISSSGGIHAHLPALAYICDNYFVGTIPHVQNIWDFVRPPQTEFDVGGKDMSEQSTIHKRIPHSGEKSELRLPREEELRVGMMVTLSHTMFFHNPRATRVDEWMLSELASHWAGNGRGVATQKIWSKDGVLIASCVQEGVVRLANQDTGQHLTQCSKSRL